MAVLGLRQAWVVVGPADSVAPEVVRPLIPFVGDLWEVDPWHQVVSVVVLSLEVMEAVVSASETEL